ncbi:hypothetical protein ACFQX6_09495 [Streptosporangium lutulentum]
MLDGCVSRFLRGGEAQDLRFFVRLHLLLDPTPAESAPRLRDYLRLLPSAPGTVAELAAGQVRGAMPLDHADLVEAVDALTFRDEAKLAATGLRWLDQAIRATPEAAADFVTALTTAYAHKSFDVRNRAAELTLKHAELFADHTGAILDAIPQLPADMGARLAARFGGERPVEEPIEAKEFPPLPEVPPLERFPEPSISPNHHERWIGWERWMAAFVAGVAENRTNLRRRLGPSIEQQTRHRRDRDEIAAPTNGRPCWPRSSSCPAPCRRSPCRPGEVLGRPESLDLGPPRRPWRGDRAGAAETADHGGRRLAPRPLPRRRHPAPRHLHHLDQRRRPGRGRGRRGRRPIPFANGRVYLYGQPSDDDRAPDTGSEEYEDFDDAARLTASAVRWSPESSTTTRWRPCHGTACVVPTSAWPTWG